MNKEFEYSNLCFLNGTNVNNKMSSEDLIAIDESKHSSERQNEVIEIYDAEKGGDPVVYTYEKFLETLDKFGLEAFAKA